jgi:ketosteroid isomerase-like protein
MTDVDPAELTGRSGTYAGDPPTLSPHEDPIGVFTALLTEWNGAIVANDADAIGAFAEPDWLFVGENGIVAGAQFLEAVAAGHVSHDMMESELHAVRIYGDVAVVIARVRNHGELAGDAFTLDEWSTDVFVRRGDGWKCVLTHLTSAAPADASDSPG